MKTKLNIGHWVTECLAPLYLFYPNHVLVMERLSPARPDYDLLTDIRAKVLGLPIKVHWKWIKGHQDDGPSHDPLDEWARANIYMDSMAKAYWNYLNQTGHCPFPQRFEYEN
jgi:hypothetical protein